MVRSTIGYIQLKHISKIVSSSSTLAAIAAASANCSEEPTLVTCLTWLIGLKSAMLGELDRDFHT
jgi:hypothetical protein